MRKYLVIKEAIPVFDLVKVENKSIITYELPEGIVEQYLEQKAAFQRKQRELEHYIRADEELAS
jgi:hypothetical protein